MYVYCIVKAKTVYFASKIYINTLHSLFVCFVTVWLWKDYNSTITIQDRPVNHLVPINSIHSIKQLLCEPCIYSFAATVHNTKNASAHITSWSLI